jgi:ABC-2 type transport system permease protein
MKAFAAMVHRELIEHRGAFLIGPLLLVAIILITTVLAFSVGRLDTRWASIGVTAMPMLLPFTAAVFLGIAWGLYLLATLFFYCADGFAADRRNNAMLFWKSMPVSDFRVLLSKLVAAITILPGAVFGVALLSTAVMLVTAYVTALVNGGGNNFILAGMWEAYWNVALIEVVQLVCTLLWYLPFMALVGAMATVVGRWAIPLSFLVPVLVAALEWVTLGGAHPFDTQTWAYLSYRATMPESGLVETWLTNGPQLMTLTNPGVAYVSDLVAKMDWTQVGIGIVFALAVIFIASEYRRRVNDN